MLTKFSYGRNVSNASFSEPLSDETKALKRKILYFSFISIIVGAFNFEFMGITGVIQFTSKPPIYLIGGILGGLILVLVVLFLIHLIDDYIKWNNEVIIESTNLHWERLSDVNNSVRTIEIYLKNISERSEEISEKVFYSAKFLESEDTFLKERLGDFYTNFENYVKNAGGISLKEFRDRSRPFGKKLGEDGERHILEKMMASMPDDVNVYALSYYLDNVVDHDSKLLGVNFVETSSNISKIYSDTLLRFQKNNLGISVIQWFMLIILEVIIPLILAYIGFKLVSDQVYTTFSVIYLGILKVA